MREQKGLVLDIDRFSSHDGPGIRAAVFLKGCPLRCGWCHSPESQPMTPQLIYQRARCTGCHACVEACPHGAVAPAEAEAEGVLGVTVDRERCRGCFACAAACYAGALRVAGRLYSAGEILALVLPDRPFYRNSGGGVTVSGGEPLMQAAFTREVLQKCRRAGIHTALETCGYGSAAELLAIAEQTDLIFYDLKHMDSGEHKRHTGVGNEAILRNLEALCRGGHAGKVTVRVPCIPGVNDDGEQIRRTAVFAKGLGITKMEIMPYNGMAGEKYKWIGAPYLLRELEAREKGYYADLREIIHQTGIEAVGER